MGVLSSIQHERTLPSLRLWTRPPKNVLRTKFRLGLFEKPYVDPTMAEAINDSKEHRDLALQAAREAIVLLKNNNTLPLKKDIVPLRSSGPVRIPYSWETTVAMA